MKIEPGFYKIKIKRSYLEYTNHYLRVYVKDRVKFLQIDNQIPTEAEKCEQEIIRHYEIVKRIINPIRVNKLRIDFTWQDEDGDNFKLTMANKFVVDQVFKLFPRLKKAFEGEQ